MTPESLFKLLSDPTRLRIAAPRDYEVAEDFFRRAWSEVYPNDEAVKAIFKRQYPDETQKMYDSYTKTYMPMWEWAYYAKELFGFSAQVWDQFGRISKRANSSAWLSDNTYVGPIRTNYRNDRIEQSVARSNQAEMGVRVILASIILAASGVLTWHPSGANYVQSPWVVKDGNAVYLGGHAGWCCADYKPDGTRAFDQLWVAKYEGGRVGRTAYELSSSWAT